MVKKEVLSEIGPFSVNFGENLRLEFQQEEEGEIQGNRGGWRFLACFTAIFGQIRAVSALFRGYFTQF